MRVFVACSLLLALSTASVAAPNVVFILADDLGWRELGCYGQEKIRTPNVDRMAAGGMKFTRFYSGNAVCAPSRCSLMTGKHPGHATVRNNQEAKPEGQFPVRADDRLLPEFLKPKGYATGAIGKWGLGMFDTPGSPLKHGFDHFFGYNCQRHAHFHYPEYLYRDGVRFELTGNKKQTGDTFSHDLFEKETLAFLDANKRRPFFLYLPYIIPHVSLQVPEDSLAEYRGKLGDDPAYDGKKGYIPHPAPHAGYAAIVTRMDQTVGRVLDKLKELGIEKNTLVVFTSDNGPTHNVGGADSTFFRSAGDLNGLKGSLYEGGIRVPFVAYWPGTIKPGTVCDERYAFWDVLPTMCELAGVSIPADTDGVSLVPTLMGKDEPNRHRFLYWEFPGYGGQQAVIRSDWKAVRQKMGTGKLKTELYDLAADPNETTDRSGDKPDLVKELERLMAEQHVPSKDFPLPGVDPKK